MDARRRGIGVLLANNALMSAGFYLLIPLLSVHLTRDAGFSATAAGAVLAVRQFSRTRSRGSGYAVVGSKAGMA